MCSSVGVGLAFIPTLSVFLLLTHTLAHGCILRYTECAVSNTLSRYNIQLFRIKMYRHINILLSCVLIPNVSSNSYFQHCSCLPEVVKMHGFYTLLSHMFNSFLFNLDEGFYLSEVWILS